MESLNYSVEENRKRVVEYLREPNLKQTSGVMRDSTGACCAFGHICDALDIPYTIKENGEFLYIDSGFQTLRLLNIDSDYMYHIMGMNDYSNMSLSEIADMLELDWSK